MSNIFGDDSGGVSSFEKLDDTNKGSIDDLLGLDEGLFDSSDEDDFTDSDSSAGNKGKLILVVSVVIVVFAVIAGAVFFDRVVSGSGSDSPGKVSEQVPGDSGSQPPVDEEPDTDSSGEEVGTPVSSKGSEGDQLSGSGVIIAFDNAFYLDKDVDSAWEYNSPDNDTTKEGLTESIASVADGTEYVAEITPKVVGKTYDVKLELTAGDKTMSYDQVITVDNVGGKFYVSDIVTK